MFNPTFTIRLPEDQRAKIAELAEREQRSQGSMIRMLLTQALEQAEAELPSARTPAKNSQH